MEPIYYHLTQPNLLWLFGVNIIGHGVEKCKKGKKLSKREKSSFEMNLSAEERKFLPVIYIQWSD